MVNEIVCSPEIEGILKTGNPCSPEIEGTLRNPVTEDRRFVLFAGKKSTRWDGGRAGATNATRHSQKKAGSCNRQ